jgi:hypothetical protein
VEQLIKSNLSKTQILDHIARAAIKAFTNVIIERAINQELLEAVKRKKARAKRLTVNLGKA